MTESSRDARRRRILERGGDRMALISGQIRDLPADSDLPQADGHSRTASCPPSISQSQLPYPPSQTIDSRQIEGKTSGLLPPNRDPVPDIKTRPPKAPSHDFDGKASAVDFPSEIQSLRDSSNNDQQLKPLLPNRDSVPDISTKPPKVRSRDLDGRGSTVEVPSQIQNPRDSSYKDQQIKTLARLCNIFPYNEVKSVIYTSESTRNFCSLAMAIVVVLAYLGFPIIGNRFVKSILFFRPLYLLLLTNITILVSPLLEKRTGLQKSEQQAGGSPSADEEGSIDQFGASLELGLVLLSVTSALFVDCSIYAVTVVCGTSLAQSLGW